jgi:hypothetical protein
VSETDRPFIEEPDEHKTGEDELFCWVPGSWERRCGGDCVAFDTRALEDPRVSTCKWLNVAGSAAMSLKKLSTPAPDPYDEEALRKVIQAIPEPPEVK